MLLVASATLTGLLLAHVIIVSIVSRSTKSRLAEVAPTDLFFVFLVPCLNEERVVARTIERLQNSSTANSAIVVIDDGSDDQTAAIVREYESDHVCLIQRVAPNARQGKGEALNYAYRQLFHLPILRSFTPDQIIVVVMDGDGRLESNALSEVAPSFADAHVGAVQIGVRMYNRENKLLTRLQDFEFVTYTEVFQRARNRSGTSGLGGNGQFTRLSALAQLGTSPWTDCLTEDLDLGLNLIVNGWAIAFCHTTWVSQQALVSIRKLIRQRARWYQGHLQCWRRIRPLVRARIRTRSALGLVHHLLSPILVAFFSIPIMLFLASLATLAIVSPGHLGHILLAHDGLIPILGYLLSFGTAIPYSLAYAAHDKSVAWPRAFLYAHAYVVYSFLWTPACWIALSKIARRQRGWAKTARSEEKADLRPVSV